MQRLGGYLIFFAIGSAILSQTNYQFRLLVWMEEMGNGAWALRALMLAVGAFMLLGNQLTQRPPQPARVAAAQAPAAGQVPSAAQPVDPSAAPHYRAVQEF